jgi:hypothetical protein
MFLKSSHVGRHRLERQHIGLSGEHSAYLLQAGRLRLHQTRQ